MQLIINPFNTEARPPLRKSGPLIISNTTHIEMNILTNAIFSLAI
jgi:hypothetical protein